MQEESNFSIHKIFENWTDAQSKLALGKMCSLRIGLKKVCITHTTKGFFAMEDACPHKLVKLSQGKLCDDSSVECYWHQYRFSLETGEELTGKNIRPVKIFKISEEKDGIYVHLPEEVEKDPFSF